ncbi:MAG: hypothetical protein DMF56_16505 [Acidobacteria bacterium]|nr:MAG: hypothetical protein DMF56_16505 [Acidobacteriota bacterium]
MLKRLFPLALALASIVAPAAFAANDEACTREMLKPIDAQATKQHIDISDLFAENNDGGEVLVARITPDGKAVLACVDSAEAAKKFLEAPIEKVGRAKAEK